MLFVQGTRDPLAELTLISGVAGRLGARATLHVVEDGDHSFKVPKRSGRTEGQVLDGLAESIADWGRRLA
jgi:predicted alpha/beta-hydrolase family hydrolase